MSDLENGNQFINRREFIHSAGALMAVGISEPITNGMNRPDERKTLSTIRIKRVDSNFEREPLNPYRFKGVPLRESWQVASLLESDAGIRKTGLCTQGVLWSDAKVFATHSERVGNALMYAITDRALQLMKGNSFTNPVTLLDDLLPDVYAYAKNDYAQSGST